MNTKLKNTDAQKGYWAVLLLLLLVASCRKDELQVEPIGEPVPWEGPTQSLTQVLDHSNLTLFKAAWKRSNMESVLASQAIKNYTLFAPTDAAMDAAGWDLNTINSAAPEELDSLLSFHTTAAPVQPDRFDLTIGSIQMITLLQITAIDEYGIPRPVPQVLYMGIHDKALTANGKAVDAGVAPQVAKNGVLYTINKVLIPPTKDTWNTLLEDERFSFYVAACGISDSMYSYNDYAAWYQPYLNIPMLTLLHGTGTLIAPTNAAFKNAGFNSIDEIRQYIESAPLPEVDFNDPNFVTPFTKMDSLLKPGLIVGGFGQFGPYSVSIFSNDMIDNKGLSSLLLEFNPYSPSGVNGKSLAIDLQYQNDAIKVRRLGSQRPLMPLIEQDIRTLNGVIHVVDAGLFPL